MHSSQSKWVLYSVNKHTLHVLSRTLWCCGPLFSWWDYWIGFEVIPCLLSCEVFFLVKFKSARVGMITNMVIVVGVLNWRGAKTNNWVRISSQDQGTDKVMGKSNKWVLKLIIPCLWIWDLHLWEVQVSQSGSDLSPDAASLHLCSLLKISL